MDKQVEMERQTRDPKTKNIQRERGKQNPKTEPHTNKAQIKKIWELSLAKETK